MRMRSDLADEIVHTSATMGALNRRKCGEIIGGEVRDKASVNDP